MKKILLFLLVLLLCGCSKKLTCTYESEYEDIKINNKIVFNFKENTYYQIDIMEFNDEKSASNYFEDVQDYVEEYNLVLQKNEIVSELEGEIKLNATKDAIKKQYESYDYKCK